MYKRKHKKMVSYYKFGETMIQIGDLVRLKWHPPAMRRQVLLVIRTADDWHGALCVQGSKKFWLNIINLEKL
jgi:hypothetical protein